MHARLVSKVLTVSSAFIDHMPTALTQRARSRGRRTPAPWFPGIREREYPSSGRSAVAWLGGQARVLTSIA